MESDGSVGRYSSITIGPDGYGLISHHDASNLDLKVVHCTNANCIPECGQTVEGRARVVLMPGSTSVNDGLGLVVLKAAHAIACRYRSSELG